MKLKPCRRCAIQPTVDEHAELYGKPHTRIHCPQCGFTIWTLNGGDKDPQTVWNDCNKNKIFQPWGTFHIATGANPVPKGYCNDECTFTDGGLAIAYDDFNGDA